MTNRVLKGWCAALAVAVLLVPLTGFAQARGGPGGEHGSRYYGGRHYGRGSYGHSGSRSSFGLWIGPGWGLGWGGSWGWGGAWGYADPYYRPYYRPYPYTYPYYSSPYRYYEPPVVVEPPPVVAPPRVVTPPPAPQEPAPEPQRGESVWYYCPDPPGYYPYVRECPNGWQKVAPTPELAQPPVQEPAAEPQAAPGPDAGDPVPYEYRWYYCQDPPGYYPYVQDCPKGWSMVAPTPAPAR